MRILVFTDTHNSTTAWKKVVEKAKKHKPEILLCGGDFTIFMQHAKNILKDINKLKIKTYIIHGNHEDEEAIEDMCEEYNYIEFIHNKAVKHKDLLIMGYGGGGFAITDYEFKIMSKQFERAIKEHTKNKKDVKKILLLHQPPHNSGIDMVYGEFAGNKTTKKFVEKYKIEFVFAGHLHENSGKEFNIKGTRYINPGPYGKIVEIK